MHSLWMVCTYYDRRYFNKIDQLLQYSYLVEGWYKQDATTHCYPIIELKTKYQKNYDDEDNYDNMSTVSNVTTASKGSKKSKGSKASKDSASSSQSGKKTVERICQCCTCWKKDPNVVGETNPKVLWCFRLL